MTVETKPEKRKKEKTIEKNGPRFLALVSSENLSVLLECFYTAYQFKRQHDASKTEIILPRSMENLAALSGVFDGVTAVQKNFRSQIKKKKVDVLYIPEPNFSLELQTLFVGAKVKIAGAKLSLPSFLKKAYRLSAAKDIDRLEKLGFRFISEILPFTFLTNPEPAVTIPSPYVWLSLFDEHEMTSSWPAGHAARLARLLGEKGIALATGMPPSAPQSLRDYFSESGIYICENPGIEERASLMSGSLVVAGPSGPELLLASFMNKPVVVLHDMHSFEHYMEQEGFRAPHELNTIRKRKSDFIATALFRSVAGPLERHIRPSSVECIKNCERCEFNSCMDLISPERVFESIKKIYLQNEIQNE